MDVREKVSNLYTSGPHEYYERFLAYLDWATHAADSLDSLISSADVDRLVLTKRHEQLLAGLDNFTIGTTQRLVNQLVSAEPRQRTMVFTARRWRVKAAP